MYINIITIIRNTTNKKEYDVLSSKLKIKN